MLRLAAPLVLSGLLALPATAETPVADVSALYDALALPEMIEIMRLEGLAYGAEIGEGLFGGPPTAEWQRKVESIYDNDQMQAAARQALAAATAGQDIGPVVAFFTTEPGSGFIRLEASARRAMLDDDIEAAAKEAAAIAMADRTARYLQVERFVEANDLIETNVTGALNSSYSFYLGLQEGGAFGGDLLPEDLLRDVASREPEIRSGTTEWVYAFLLLAYDPVSDADLERYIEFSETDAGRKLNRAIFGAFDDMFDDISRSLGRAAAIYMQGEQL
jgi:hypothetical protein